MLTLLLKNLEATYGNDFLNEDEKIMSYLDNIQHQNLGFYSVIDEKETVKKIMNEAQKRQGHYKNIVVLGIGGSALGTICLNQSLTPLFNGSAHSQKFPQLIVIDNIDPTLIEELEHSIALSETLFIVVTKSGNTPETLAQFLYFMDKIKKANREVEKHFIAISEQKNSPLVKIAEKENIPLYTMPENVGGRFSVLTSVGLLPAALIGIDIEKLITGAQNMRNAFLNKNFEQNLPFQLALIQYRLYQKGIKLNVLMPYAQKLIRLADWYRQLLAESIGKKYDRSGQEVYVGITPINALGVTDQHSQSQLYNEGPNDKLHLFLSVKNLKRDLPIPPLPKELPELQYLDHITFGKLLKTEMEGTAQALTKNGRPNLTIEIDEINEYTLGELFMFFEGATAFLGEFFNINAFDQPGVELSKNITRELLSQKKKI